MKEYRKLKKIKKEYLSQRIHFCQNSLWSITKQYESGEYLGLEK